MFFRIKEANAEIKRLNAELTRVNTELSELKSSIETNDSETATQAEAFQKTAEKNALELASEKAAHQATKADLVTAQNDLKVAKEQLGKAGEQTIKLAAAKAAEITAAQGQPAIPTAPAATPADAGKKDFSHLKGLELAIAAHKADSAAKN